MKRFLWLMSTVFAFRGSIGRLHSPEDFPRAMICRDIGERSPGSKFILTRHANPDLWFRCLCKHAGIPGLTACGRSVSGYQLRDKHKADHIRCIERHLASVRSCFHGGAGYFPEVCREERDDWDER